MKKTMNKIAAGIYTMKLAAKAKLADNKGDFIVNHAMVAVIVLVLGAIILSLIGPYLKNEFFPLLTSKITDFFN